MLAEFIMPRLCVSSLVWRARGLSDVARAMMRLGLNKLELASAPLAPAHYKPGGPNTSIFNILAEAGIHVLALRVTGLEYGQKVEAIAEAGKRGIPLVLDRAERLNFPDMVDRLQIYAICAAQAGVQFIIENDAHGSCDGAAAQVALARTLRHPALAFALSPPHALAGGHDLAEEIRTLGDKLRIAYLWDAPTGVARGSSRGGFPDHLFFEDSPLPSELSLGGAEGQVPGNQSGTVDWRGYLQALAENGFRGMFNLAWLGEDWSDERIEGAVRKSIAHCLEAGRQADF